MRSLRASIDYIYINNPDNKIDLRLRLLCFFFFISLFLSVLRSKKNRFKLMAKYYICRSIFIYFLYLIIFIYFAFSH